MQVKKYVGENIQDVIWKVKGDLGADAVIIHTRRYKDGGFLGIFGGKDKVEVVAAVAQLDASFNLEKQITELKSFIQKVVAKPNGGNRFTPAVEELYNSLRENELEPSLAEELSWEIEKSIPATDLAKKTMILDFLEKMLKSNILVGEPIETGKGKLIAVIGPTGVGKTTTLAKLTAYFSLIENKSVALITADTYRIAAVEQLRTYGEIMGIPVEAVYTPKELAFAVEKYQDKELIFLDTAGRSQKKEQQMAELQDFLNAVQPEEIYLLLSATTKYKDLIDIAESFQQVNFHKLIFTKLDETNSYGSMLSFLYHLKKPVAYLTVGQNVPDDIKKASYDELFNSFFKGLGS